MAGSFFATTGTEDLANLQTQEEIQESSENRPSSRWLRAGFWACIVISVAVVLRRIVALAHPPHSAPPQLAALDAVFASHATLTLGAYSPCVSFCRGSALFCFEPSCRQGLARAPAFSPRRSGRNYRLRDERLFRRGMAGTLCGPLFQYPLCCSRCSRRTGI